MKVEQIYTGCLSQGAYYIESAGEAVIIDPLREINPYLERAKKDKAVIKYILETHFHADFVSGHIDLACKTGATIVFGPTAKTDFEAHVATDGELLKVGKVTIKVIHTPGHTLESCCYLLLDENGNETAIFTGDTLFIGDVGRPDVAQETTHISSEELAGILYDSLHNKIVPLADHLVVYPAHGAGSACGKNMSKETTDTLGHQKQTNYALNKNLSKQQFIQELTTDLGPMPAYFPFNVQLNKHGYEAIDQVLKSAQNALTPDEFEQMANRAGALVIDTRTPEAFANGFIPNAINIGIDGSFAPWVGTLITDIKHPLLIVTDPGRDQEVVTRLARVGYDNCLGYLQGGIAEWIAAGKEVDTIDSISAEALADNIDKDVIIVDVRKENEYQAEHVNAAVNVPLDTINDSMAQLPKNKTAYVHCTSGYRSMIFISILRARGYHNLLNVNGGFNAIKATSGFQMQR
jgi:hydroxyacylglutathione hydrolase